MKAQAHYDYETVTEKYVLIADLNDGARTITNDAEAVVEEVHNSFPGRRIFYRDTEGVIDELDHVNGRFRGFDSGPRDWLAFVREMA